MEDFEELGASLVTQKPSALPEICEEVWENEEISTRELRERLDISRHVCLNNLDKLEKLGLVEEVEVGKRLELTQAGKETSPDEIEDHPREKYPKSEIFSYIQEHEPLERKELKTEFGMSNGTLSRKTSQLEEFIKKPEISKVYKVGEPSPEPEVICWLGELRHERQFEICEYAVEKGEFDAMDLKEDLGLYRSTGRRTAQRLSESDFLEVEWRASETSLKKYETTPTGKEELKKIDSPESYCGRDGRHIGDHRKGIQGTKFRNPYEIGDFLYLEEVGKATAQEIAEALNKYPRKTKPRLDRMEERGLVKGEKEKDRMVFSPTRKTFSLIEGLERWGERKSLDRKREKLKDRYPIDEIRQEVSGLFYPRDLDSALDDLDYEPSVKEVDYLLRELKNLNLIKGNRSRGYSWAE